LRDQKYIFLKKKTFSKNAFMCFKNFVLTSSFFKKSFEKYHVCFEKLITKILSQKRKTHLKIYFIFIFFWKFVL